MDRLSGAYCELHARSAFSLQDGASLPEDLARRAADLGLPALALTDRDDLGGAVRFAEAAAEHGIRPLLGAELSLDGGGSVVLLCEGARGWANLSTLITRARMGRPRGAPAVDLDTLARHADGLVCLSGGREGALDAAAHAGGSAAAERLAGTLAECFPRGFYVEVSDHALTEDVPRIRQRLTLARRLRVPWVVTGDVRHATAADKLVHDALRCLSRKIPLDEAGDALFPNDARRLRSADEMHRTFRDAPAGVWRTLEVAERCRFRLADLRPSLPRFPLPEGVDDADAYLAQLVREGARRRYGLRFTDRHRAQVAHELEVIRRLGLAGYFLIVWEIVRFARHAGVLAQGRGSAANSAVCYCLEITAVDPIGCGLLFERFLSEGRDEPPDIDVDLAHQDRERVLQHVYERYGRDHAAMVCTTVTWGARSAVRDAARVLGLPAEVGDRLAKEVGPSTPTDGPVHTAGAGARELSRGGLARAGLDPRSGTARALVRLVRGLADLPRHRGIHVGGFVLTGEPLHQVVPIEPASMDGRTVIQWDKDDLDPVGLVKIDLLGLGILTLLSGALDLVETHHGRRIDLGQLPPDDPETFALIRRADTVGVFQIESRAQMNTLPRTRPDRFYDLVVQVALVRPGPIQGEMVHPYLRRRRGEEPVRYLHPSLEPVLERTLGVPLFQEQGMKVAVAAAGFSAAQADELRRAMSSKRSGARMARLSLALIDGMRARGIDDAVAERIVAQLTAFASYGFPESHAASFALLVYASAWLKVHHAPAFYAAILDAQPMGFYPVGTLVADARRRGVEVRGPDALRSAWACTLEPASGPHRFAVRVGLSLVRGVGEAQREALARAGEAARRCLATTGLHGDAHENVYTHEDGDAHGDEDDGARGRGGLEALAAFVDSGGLPRRVLASLARAGAFDALVGDRRRALWEVLRLARPRAGPLDRPAPAGAPPALAPPTEGERVIDEYATFGATTGRHPMALLRERLPPDVLRAEALARHRGGPVRVAGLVNSRQAPMTAKGFVFLSLEDETGMVNVVVSPQLAARQRRALVDHPVLLVEGELQRHQGARNVKAARLVPVRDVPGATDAGSHDFH
ncbi:MAG TPA: error-prone DNA polymerase [Sandaracinaceae bacterium LLY-WYZ-13_1]|nr:error-prone DNA polymerase [Sandaracinaceae bacterium LLY-WYZ-13_1]